MPDTEIVGSLPESKYGQEYLALVLVVLAANGGLLRGKSSRASVCQEVLGQSGLNPDSHHAGKITSAIHELVMSGWIGLTRHPGTRVRIGFALMRSDRKLHPDVDGYAPALQELQSLLTRIEGISDHLVNFRPRI